MSQNRGGDQLAQGAVKFQFQPAGSGLTEDAWLALFETEDETKRRRDANVRPTGDAGASTGKGRKGKK